MGALIRISGHGALSITLTGLPHEQEVVLQRFTAASSAERGFPPASAFSSRGTSAGVVLSGTARQLKNLTCAIASNTTLPAELSKKIDSLLDNYQRSDYKIDCRGKVLDLGSRTHIMGILNVTPDSFSDGGLYSTTGGALAHAREMASSGADIIDIGGESTRPGAEPVSAEEELRRIIPVIKQLSTELPVPISVDTYKASVAEKALAAGASIVNDISGLRFSPDMAKIVANYGAALVIMHTKGTPRSMQVNPVYTDIISEITDYLDGSIEIAMREGVDREKVMIDPGIGFGKNLTHNLTLLKRLDEFRVLGRPILIGPSRKKFIGTVLDISEPEKRVDGTAAAVALAIAKGARVVRVHDVACIGRVARMTDAIYRQV